MIEAANVGQVDVVISMFGVSLPGKSGQLVFPGIRPTVDLPKRLTPGQSATFAVPKALVVDGLQEHGYHGKVKIRPYVSDQLGTSTSETRLSMTYPSALHGRRRQNAQERVSDK